MKKILLLSIDGLGLSDMEEGNAIAKANMPFYKSLFERFPHANIAASGAKVGLPEGQPGNKAVGYKTLAAGQVLKQRSSFIHDFMDIDSLATNTELKSAIEQCKKHNSTFHVMGLMSTGGKNANIDDTVKILEFLKTQEIKVGVDFIADGKDVETKSVLKYIEKINETGVPILTVCGRYYAMDEEQKPDRTRIYYDLVRNGIGLKVKEINLALKNCYMRNITDEFLPPIIVEEDSNIKDNDVVFWTNYQSDGAKEILTALTNPDDITDFQTRHIKNLKMLMMYPIDSKINATVLINEEDDMSNSLGLYFSKLDITQARIASKDNYEYVTYYFNGEKSEKVSKCYNCLVDNTEEGSIPSCVQVTKQIMRSMEKDTEFILASFDDLIDNTIEKVSEKLEAIDKCLEKIFECAELNFYTIFITSPFGNVEQMIDDEGKIKTTNSLNDVPLIVSDPKLKLLSGTLTDIAPTILSYMDISIPSSMKDSKILIEE